MIPNLRGRWCFARARTADAGQWTKAETESGDDARAPVVVVIICPCNGPQLLAASVDWNRNAEMTSLACSRANGGIESFDFRQSRRRT